jgi:hypothetical protein
VERDGLVVSLSPIGPHERGVKVSADVYMGPWSAHGSQYVVAFRNDEWKVVGLIGVWTT